MTFYCHKNKGSFSDRRTQREAEIVLRSLGPFHTMRRRLLGPPSLPLAQTVDPLSPLIPVSGAMVLCREVPTLTSAAFILCPQLLCST